MNKLGKGIPNMGNTCYIASVLQCLRYSRKFVYQLREHNTKNDTTLMKFFVELLYDGASKNVLNAFIQQLSIDHSEFRLLRQCDAHELYLYLIDQFYEKNKNYNNPFMGKLESTIECSICQHRSVTETPFISLSLEMDKMKSLSVQELMEKFCSTETLDDPIECDKCKKKQPSAKLLRVKEMPDILVIHLKRFTGLMKNNVSVKLDKMYNTYNLYAVVNHMGGAMGGHYTAACKRRNGEWRMCNDNFITELNAMPSSSPAPYILFYSI